jgi:Ca-activated chloride channel family protein
MFGIALQTPLAIGGAMILSLLAASFWWVGYRARIAARASYGEARLVDRHSPPLNLRREVLYLSGYTATMLLLGLAAAGPVMQGSPLSVSAGAVDVVVVTDVSPSMASEEYRSFMPSRDGLEPSQVRGAYGSRLDFVKHTIESRIMSALSNNRLGIVTYSGLGFTQAELTHDHPSLRWILRHWMPIGGAPGNGSDFASGLNEALMLFGDEARERVIVLFSDGGFTGSRDDLRQVVAELQRRGVRLVTVGVGGDEPSPIPQYSPLGELRGNLLRNGQPVLTHFEEEPLLALRAATNGEYIRMAPGDALNIRWANVLAGERVEMGVRHLFAFPLSAALFLLCLLQMRGIFRKTESMKENR